MNPVIANIIQKYPDEYQKLLDERTRTMIGLCKKIEFDKSMFVENVDFKNLKDE